MELHGTLGNVSVQSMQGDTVVLEIPSEVKAEDQPGPPLILTVKFRLEGGIQAVFAGAEVIVVRLAKRMCNLTDV